MAKVVYVNKPTPNGGVRSEGRYLDDNFNPVDEDVATRIEIIEYDAEDNEIHRTIGVCIPQSQR